MMHQGSEPERLDRQGWGDEEAGQEAGGEQYIDDIRTIPAKISLIFATLNAAGMGSQQYKMMMMVMTPLHCADRGVT